MPSWNDFKDHTRSTYKLQEEQGNMLSMVWSYDGNRSQKIIVRHFEAYDREMIEFKSAFAHSGDVDAAAMLRKNAELPLATIALTGDTLFVVYNAPLEHLHIEDYDFYLSRVAAVADTLEETHAQRDVF